LSVTGAREYTVKSLEQALDILEAFGEVGEEVQLSKLSQKLKMDKSKLFRLLSTFVGRGYVEKEQETGKYRLGLAMYEIGQKSLVGMTLWRKAKPIMERLARDCAEAVYLVVPRGDDEILMLDMVDACNPVGILTLVGQHFSLPQSAAGRIIQAYNAEKNGSLVTRKSLESFASLRKAGFSADVGSLGDGIACLAVPLLNERELALGCLCFVGPEFRFTEEKAQKELLPLLRAAGQTISMQLGCRELEQIAYNLA
jgi:IclR family transcriptional regulator, KDG regulon repressor